MFRRVETRAFGEGDPSAYLEFYMTPKERKIAALRSAMTTAEASLQNVVDILVVLEGAFPTPAPPQIQKLKERFGAVAQNWTDARNFADAELRKL